MDALTNNCHTVRGWVRGRGFRIVAEGVSRDAVQILTDAGDLALFFFLGDRKLTLWILGNNTKSVSHFNLSERDTLRSLDTEYDAAYRECHPPGSDNGIIVRLTTKLSELVGAKYFGVQYYCGWDGARADLIVIIPREFELILVRLIDYSDRISILEFAGGRESSTAFEANETGVAEYFAPIRAEHPEFFL